MPDELFCIVRSIELSLNIIMSLDVAWFSNFTMNKEKHAPTDRHTDEHTEYGIAPYQPIINIENVHISIDPLKI